MPNKKDRSYKVVEGCDCKHPASAFHVYPNFAMCDLCGLVTWRRGKIKVNPIPPDPNDNGEEPF